MSLPRYTYVVLLLFAAYSVDAAPVIEQPRVFGHVIGDVLEQRIGLPGPITSTQLTSLGEIERVNGWLERLSAEVSRDAEDQLWLTLRYQITNAPMQTEMISLPSLNLALEDGGQRNVASWSVAVSPLIPPGDTDRLPPLYPDRPPKVSISPQAPKRLRYFVTALLGCLLGWFGWWLWRGYHDSRWLPFARAQHEIKRLPADNLDDNAQAWLLLHHAINASAGRSIQANSIDQLIARQPWLASSQGHIEAFFAVSAARFFAQSESVPGFALREFCDALYSAEKKHSTAPSLP